MARGWSGGRVSVGRAGAGKEGKGVRVGQPMSVGCGRSANGDGAEE